MRALVLGLLLVGCSKSGDRAETGGTGGSGAAGSSGGAAGTSGSGSGAARTGGHPAVAPDDHTGEDQAGNGAAPDDPAAPGHVADCPTELEVDCDRLVPKDVRARFFAGAAPALERGHVCVWADGAQSVSVEARSSERTDWLGQLRNKRRFVEGVGRAADHVGDDVEFFPTGLDCEVHVRWRGDLGQATALARALDGGLSKAVLAPKK